MTVLILGKRTVNKTGCFGAYVLRGAHHINEQGQFRVDGKKPGWHWDSWGWNACGYFRWHVNRDLNVEKKAGRPNFVEHYRERLQGLASWRVPRYRQAWSAWEKQNQPAGLEHNEQWRLWPEGRQKREREKKDFVILQIRGKNFGFRAWFLNCNAINIWARWFFFFFFAMRTVLWFLGC